MKHSVNHAHQTMLQGSQATATPGLLQPVFVRRRVGRLPRNKTGA